MNVTRRLAAILAADVVGFSRLMEADEAGTLAALKARRKDVLEPLVAKHQGRVFKITGDGVLVEFASAVNAVQCAVELQQAFAKVNDGVLGDRHIVLRIGVILGDVMVEGGDLYGDGINIAARLEGIAEPGGICISGTAHDHVGTKVKVAFEDIGPQTLKNIAQPVRAYRARLDGSPALKSQVSASLPLPDKPSIAVLPFTNMSGDPEQEYFSDGITEDIITELSRFRSLFVIARNSSFQYRGKNVDVRRVARELGVQYVVEGSVRKAAGRVRVTVQFVEAETGNHLWAEKYDRELADIFAVQDEVVKEIASAIPGRLDTARIDRARRKPSQSLTAYEYLLRGEWLRLQDFGSTEPLRMFEKAIEIDPHCARAYCRLAWHHAYSVLAHGTAIEEAQRLARAFADKALASDPNDALVHATTAVTFQMMGSHDLARRHLEKAIALNPNDIWIVRSAGFISAYLGDFAEARNWTTRYLRLDPHFPDGVREMLFDVYFMTGRYEDAVAAFQGWPNPPPHMYCELAAAHAHLGKLDRARAAISQFERVRPANYDGPKVAHVHARMCRRQEDTDRWLEGYRMAGLPV